MKTKQFTDDGWYTLSGAQRHQRQQFIHSKTQKRNIHIPTDERKRNEQKYREKWIERKKRQQQSWMIYSSCFFIPPTRGGVPGHTLRQWIFNRWWKFVRFFCVVCVNAHRSVRFHHFTVHIPKKIAETMDIHCLCAHIWCTEQKPEQQFSSYTWCIFPATNKK